MAERLVQMSDAELEQALADLGRHLAYPPTPNLVARVGHHLAQRQTRPRPFWQVLLPVQRRIAVALLALLLAAGAALVVSPELRSAVAQRLGVRGVQISQVPASPAPVSPGARLSLGQRATLDQARAMVTFPVLVPAAPGAPDEVSVLESPPGGQVVLIYYPRPDLPQANATGVGLLLSEFQADIHTAGPLGKGLPPGTRLEEVQIAGGRGYWIDGDPHVFFFVNARGQVQSETTRLAANVLLWEHGTLTLRLESALPKDGALAIAASVQ